MSHVTSQIGELTLSTLSLNEAYQKISNWSPIQHGSKQVSFCNVHVLGLSLWSPSLRDALCSSDLVLPDGAPVAWLMRLMGHTNQRRIAGPDFMLAYLEQAAKRDESIFLMGSNEANLQKLEEGLLETFPSLTIAGSYAPPFRPLTDLENKSLLSMIQKSGAKTVWVGLGCPKQEIWIHQNRHAVPAIFLGVGAAFDFLSGAKPRAPKWMQDWGLEWLFRLCSEPRRLFVRYLLTNTVFLWIVFNELVLRPLIRKSRSNRPKDLS